MMPAASHLFCNQVLKSYRQTDRMMVFSLAPLQWKAAAFGRRIDWNHLDQFLHQFRHLLQNKFFGLRSAQRLPDVFIACILFAKAYILGNGSAE